MASERVHDDPVHIHGSERDQGTVGDLRVEEHPEGCRLQVLYRLTVRGLLAVPVGHILAE